MGLSAELQRYAENIWRRFPEVFISLGSPNVEDVFELRAPGAWSHSIVETKSEKVIEIVLPRKELLGGEAADEDAVPLARSWFSSFDGDPALEEEDDEQPPSTLEADDIAVSFALASFAIAESPPRPDSPSNAICATGQQIDRLSRAICHLDARLEECVAREVRAQLRLGDRLAEGLAAQLPAPDLDLPPRAGRHAAPPESFSAHLAASSGSDGGGGGGVVAGRSRAGPSLLSAVFPALPCEPQARVVPPLEGWHLDLPERTAGQEPGVHWRREVAADTSSWRSPLSVRRNFPIAPVITRGLRTRFPPGSVTKLPSEEYDDSPGAHIQWAAAQRRAEQPRQTRSDSTSPGEPLLPGVTSRGGSRKPSLQDPWDELSPSVDDSPGSRIQRCAVAQRRRDAGPLERGDHAASGAGAAAGTLPSGRVPSLASTFRGPPPAHTHGGLRHHGAGGAAAAGHEAGTGEGYDNVGSPLSVSDSLGGSSCGEGHEAREHEAERGMFGTLSSNTEMSCSTLGFPSFLLDGEGGVGSPTRRRSGWGK